MDIQTRGIGCTSPCELLVDIRGQCEHIWLVDSIVQFFTYTVAEKTKPVLK